MLTMLALTMTIAVAAPEAGPARAAAWSAVEGTYEGWIRCTTAAAGARGAEAIPPETIAEEAVAGCGAPEVAWREAYVAWLGASHGDPASVESMAALARCHMIQHGAQAVIVNRPVGTTRLPSRATELERRCRALAPAPAEAAH